MPFDLTGATNTSTGASTLRVEPEQVLHLKAELQLIHDEVEGFLNTRAQAMAMRPLGADPVSSETADAFNENAHAAIKAATGYQRALEDVLGALTQVAKTYNLVEDTTAQTFRQATQ
jgi:uncharacterized protein YukE